MRAAVANRTFEAVGESDFKHNAVSAAIATKPDVRSWLEYVREDGTPAAFALSDAIARWPGATTPQHTAFALSTADHLPMFDAIASDPRRAERFTGAMHLLSSANAGETTRMSEALELDTLPDGASIIDIGGASGNVISQILRRYKQLRGIVQDLPTVVANASVPEDLTGRLAFQVHDLFTEQSAKNADVYFLRKILHDWSDEYAQRVIRNLVPAMNPGARVVLNELCLPRSGGIHPRREQTQRGWDLAMKWMLNGKEREEQEWKALFASVDKRFVFAGVKPVPGASSSLIEFVWDNPI